MKSKLITLLSVIILYFNPITGYGQSRDKVTIANINPATPTIMVPAMMGPAMGLTSSYALFSTNGTISNTGITFITGDLGTNVGKTTGFDPLNVKGILHLLPDGATNMCTTSLLTVYNYLNLLPVNFELLNSAQFGHNMILSPQTYHLNAATMLTDTLYFNALGDPNAVFCIKINGALTTTANSRVILLNGAQSKNIYWKIEGAVSIFPNSIFRGIIVSNNGAITLESGVMLDGCAFTTNGAITTNTATVVSPTATVTTAVDNVDINNTSLYLTVAPNPFGSYTTINLKDDSKLTNCNLTIYNAVGVEVLTTKVTQQLTTLQTGQLRTGIYFYKLVDNNKIIQSGKLISQNR